MKVVVLSHSMGNNEEMQEDIAKVIIEIVQPRNPLHGSINKISQVSVGDNIVTTLILYEAG